VRCPDRCTGDDKSNLVVGLLAKTEFGAQGGGADQRCPQRVDVHPGMGYRLAVSTPGPCCRIEGAIDVGHLVRLMGLHEAVPR